ncbi:hypothetical protein [Lentzea terrae]|uniref:hypothetical protein n=1 Tax=Lentzea terrae TaxID=2200761 RepID=UPI000DD35181|nr:hypothetical protein [Lentzea terrae]
MDDDLDDELRRLFSDDRLDVHVAPDAADAVVRGAHRRRRRRSAMTATFALVALVGAGIGLTQLRSPSDDPVGDLLPTSMPTSSSAPPSSSISSGAQTTTVTAPPTAPNATGSNPGAGGTTGKSTPKPTTTTPPPALPSESSKVGKLVLGMSEANALATGSLVEPGTSAGSCTTYATTLVPDSDAAVISPANGIVRLTLPGYAKTQRGISAGSSVADVKTAYPSATQSGSTLLVQMAGTPKWTYVFETDGAAVTVVRMRLNANDCPV